MSDLIERACQAFDDSLMERGDLAGVEYDRESQRLAMRAAFAVLRDADLREYIESINREMRERKNEFSLTLLWQTVVDAAIK